MARVTDWLRGVAVFLAVSGGGVLTFAPVAAQSTEPSGAPTTELEIDMLEEHALELQRANRMREAEAEFLRALTARERIEGPDASGTWLAIVQLGDFYRGQGRLDEAMAKYIRVATAGEARLAAGHQENDDWRASYISALVGIAGVHHARHQVAEAERLYLRGIELWGSNALMANYVREGLANLYRENGRTAEAEQIAAAADAAQTASDAADLAAAADAPPAPDLSQTDRAIALIDGAARLVEGRHYADAERDFLAAIHLVDTTAGRDYVVALTGRERLAGLYVEVGRYSEAEPLYREVLESHQRNDSPSERYRSLNAIVNLALLDIRLDRNAEAERLLLEASSYLRQFGAVANGLFGPDFRDALLYTINSHMGWLYYRQGRYAEAEPILLQALERFSTYRGADRLNVLVLPVLADVYVAQSRLTEAEALLAQGIAAEDRAARTAVTEAHAIAGRTDNVLVSYLVSLANIYSQQNRYAEAMPLYARAVSIAERTLGPSHDQTLSAHLAQADANAAQHLDAVAEGHYAQVLTLANERFGRQHILSLRAAAGLTRTQLAQPAKAMAAIDAARPLIEAWRARLSHGDVDQIGRAEGEREADVRRGSFALFANAAWLPARAGSAAMERMRPEAFRALQDAMTDPTGGATTRAAARRAADRTQGGLGALAREREGLEERLASNISVTSQTFESVGADGVLRRAELRVERQQIESRIQAIDARMRVEFPAYFSLARPATLSIEEVQARLGPDDAMLLVLPTAAGMHSVAVTRDGAVWARSAWTADQVDAAVQRLRWDLGARTSVTPELRRAWQAEDRACVAPAFHRAIAHQLYTEIFGEVAPLLAGKRRLFVVAAGPLAALPFSVLTVTPSQGADNDAAALRATSWLADQFALVNLPTVQSIGSLAARSAPGAVPSADAFVGFGDPLLLGTPRPSNCGRPTAAPQQTEARSASRSGGNVTNANTLRRLSRLPGTAVELENMRGAFGAPTASLHLADRATETAVRTADLSNARVIAFATHGLVGDELTSLVEPGLVFTPPRVGSDDDDGYLAASEVAGLRLNADWVILSACNTATGRQSQSLSSLSRAFLYAGARGLLASHWEVDDEVASRLTVRTVQLERTGMTRAAAFQQAMHEIRMDTSHDRPEASWAHPAFWAPFVLIGDSAG